MDVHRILAELRAERQRIDEAILTVERLASGHMGKRRGRAPKWMARVTAAAAERPEPETKTKRKFSEATRKRMAEAQRKRWASRKTNGQAA